MSATRSTLYLPLYFSLSIGAATLPGCGTKSISADPTAIPARATVTASEQAPPPSYVMKFDGLQLVVDANAVVQSSSVGTVVLRAPNGPPQAGEEWKVFDEAQRCCQTYSFAEIDGLYKSGAPVDSASLAGPEDLNISWSRFGLLDKTLPSSRVLIVRRTNSSGLHAYQLFDVLFPGPSR